ncbi:MAG: hypothetical protein DRN71_02555 [Candidatus Nanohalarchaeota archaeon]|nr:MAG: hypothetical protein DRN71_02555 [Candidatus Nanohaloarchaeota archaeon]
MPSEELQAQRIETATSEQAYNPTDIDNSSTAENPDNTIYTPKTQPDDTSSNIYNTIIKKEETEWNIEPPITTPQINLTTSPDKTVADTETYPTPQPQYTGTLTTPKTQESLLVIYQQRNPQIATVGGPAPHNSLDEIYKSLMNAHEIDTEYLEKAEVSLLDTIEYLINTDEKDTEIYALKLTEEIYKDTISSEPEYEETTRTINAYLDFLKDAGVLEAGEFKKVYDDGKTELMEHTYTINQNMLNILNTTYKSAQEKGLSELGATESNELFIDYLENNLNEINRDWLTAHT